MKEKDQRIAKKCEGEGSVKEKDQRIVRKCEGEGPEDR